MQTKRTRQRAPDEQRATHYDELEARSTMSRLQLAVDEGDESRVRPRRSGGARRRGWPAGCSARPGDRG